MVLTRTANLILNGLLTLAYPQPCTLCGSSVEDRTLDPACAACWSTTRVFTGEEALCWKCGALGTPSIRPVSPEKIYCHRCDTLEFQSARACGIYEGALRASVLRLKHKAHLSRKLRDLFIDCAKRSPLNSATRIVPVPLHPEREQRRGFNQAAIIARSISPVLGLVVDETSLVRIVASEKYRAGLDSRGRHDTVAGAFAVRFPQVVEGESILLIDDVFTTGATASSCAAALLAAGALDVQVLTAARPR